MLKENLRPSLNKFERRNRIDSEICFNKLLKTIRHYCNFHKKVELFNKALDVI